MKRIGLLLIAIAAVVTLHAQEKEIEIDGAWMKKHYSKAEYMVPMSDGVKLYTAVYAPKNKKIKSPILLCRTQAGCEPYGKKAVALWRDDIYQQYLQSEYILVFQDVRGKGNSEGVCDMMQAENDAYSTVEWLQRKLRRHNGRVGVWGVGGDGGYAMTAATCGHPAIKAVSPQAIFSTVALNKPLTSAMMFVGGLFDSESKDSAWYAYDAVKSTSPNVNSRLVVGPWLHNVWRQNGAGVELGEIYLAEEANSNFYQNEIEYPFFDHYLRGDEVAYNSCAGALIYFTGENCWREILGWSRDVAVSYVLYFGEQESLASQKSDEVNSFSIYESDPENPVPYYYDLKEPIKEEWVVASQQFLARRDDVLTFSSSVLEHDITAVGEIEVELYAQQPHDKVDFVVKIIDEAPNGESEMMVRCGVMPKESVEYEMCGNVRKYKFVLPSVAHTFLEGHTIKVQLQNSLYPLCPSEKGEPYQVKIYHDVKYPSSVKFSILK